MSTCVRDRVVVTRKIFEQSLCNRAVPTWDEFVVQTQNQQTGLPLHDNAGTTTTGVKCMTYLAVWLINSALWGILGVLSSLSWVFGFVGTLLYGYGLFRYITRRDMVLEERNDSSRNGDSINVDSRGRTISIQPGTSHYDIVISRMWILVPLCVAVSLTYLVSNLIGPYLEDNDHIVLGKTCALLLVLMPHLGVSVQAWKRYRPVTLILNMYFGTLAVLYLTVDIAAEANGIGSDFDGNEPIPVGQEETLIFPRIKNTTSLIIDPSVQQYIDDRKFDYPFLAALREANYLNQSHVQDLEQAVANAHQVSPGRHPNENETSSPKHHDPIPTSEIVFPERMIDAAHGENLAASQIAEKRNGTIPRKPSSRRDSDNPNNATVHSTIPADEKWSKWDLERGLCYWQALACLLLILRAAKQGKIEAGDEVSEAVTWLIHIAGFTYFFGLFPLLEMPEFSLIDNSDLVKWGVFIALVQFLLVFAVLFSKWRLVIPVGFAWALVFWRVAALCGWVLEHMLGVDKTFIRLGVFLCVAFFGMLCIQFALCLSGRHGRSRHLEILARKHLITLLGIPDSGSGQNLSTPLVDEELSEHAVVDPDTS